MFAGGLLRPAHCQIEVALATRLTIAHSYQQEWYKYKYLHRLPYLGVQLGNDELKKLASPATLINFISLLPILFPAKLPYSRTVQLIYSDCGLPICANIMHIHIIERTCISSSHSHCYHMIMHCQV